MSSDEAAEGQVNCLEGSLPASPALLLLPADGADIADNCA
eukprot:XP_001707552.1 Hypothetical protein GL50803_99562 [Giardia lamblia ATCC 50803]